MSVLPEISRSNQFVDQSKVMVVENDYLPLEFVRIEVDATPVTLPDYAQNLSLKDFWWYLDNADQVRKTGEWETAVGGVIEGFNRATFEALINDERFCDYLVALVRHGPEERGGYGFNEFSFTRCASLLADELSKNGKALEVISPQGKNYKDWGGFLKRGLIILRGSAESVETLSGGTLYVDGDVNFIKGYGFDDGIVYVSGNVNRLQNTEKLILVVAGQIGEYENDTGHSNFTLQTKRIPSPFIFSSHPIVGTMKKRRFVFRDNLLSFARGNTYFSHDRPFQGVYVVPKEKLINWKPEETKQKALALCKGRTKDILDKLADLCESFDDPSQIKKFWKTFIFGYESGRVAGRSSGLRDR